MPVVAFTLNGQRFELTSEVVEARLVGVEPEPIREHAVRIGRVWFPVKQAFEKAVDVRRTEFTSHAARRHLVALGFEVRGDTVDRAQDPSEPRPSSAEVVAKAGASIGSEWHTEANVQRQSSLPSPRRAGAFSRSPTLRRKSVASTSSPNWRAERLASK